MGAALVGIVFTLMPGSRISRGNVSDSLLRFAGSPALRPIEPRGLGFRATCYTSANASGFGTNLLQFLFVHSGSFVCLGSSFVFLDVSKKHFANKSDKVLATTKPNTRCTRKEAITAHTINEPVKKIPSLSFIVSPLGQTREFQFVPRVLVS